jgi:hypothetical protein
MAEKGHDDQFPPPWLSARYRFGDGTFAGDARKARDAPFPAVRGARSGGRSRPFSDLAGTFPNGSLARQAGVRFSGAWRRSPQRPMPTVEVDDAEKAGFAELLRQTIAADPFPLSPRVQQLGGSSLTSSNRRRAILNAAFRCPSDETCIESGS